MPYGETAVLRRKAPVPGSAIGFILLNEDSPRPVVVLQPSQCLPHQECTVGLWPPCQGTCDVPRGWQPPWQPPREHRPALGLVMAHSLQIGDNLGTPEVFGELRQANESFSHKAGTGALCKGQPPLRLFSWLSITPASQLQGLF